MTRLFIADVSDLSDTSFFNEALSYVSDYRKEKVASLKREEDKLLSLGAGYLFEKQLHSLYGLSPRELRFSGGQKEKPRIVGREDIYFSLSHSGKYSLAAFSEKEIGADLQKIVPFREGFAKKILSEKELGEVFSFPEDKRDEAFIRNWAIKESYMKYRGRGLYLPIRTLEAERSADSSPLIYCRGEKQSDISLFEFSLPGYCICLCTPDNFVPSPETVSLKKL